MRNQLSQRDDFYPQIVKLVIPIIIQNLLSAAVNSADVIMLNFVVDMAVIYQCQVKVGIDIFSKMD